MFRRLPTRTNNVASLTTGNNNIIIINSDNNNTLHCHLRPVVLSFNYDDGRPSDPYMYRISAKSHNPRADFLMT